MTLMNSSSHFARRVLLHSAALTARALLLRPQALAAADPSRELKFLVISDTHLGYKARGTGDTPGLAGPGRWCRT